MKKGNPFREAFYAIKTKRYAPDLTLFEYWVWRIVHTRPSLKHCFYQAQVNEGRKNISL